MSRWASLSDAVDRIKGVTLLEELPKPFLDVRVHDASIAPDLVGLCAGYEDGKWRSAALASHCTEWLPQFALSYREYASVSGANMVRLLAKAAAVVYSTDKYGKRGEFGELLLHIAIRQVYGTIPAISKLYYKDSSNDTVKGFDCVHVVEKDAHNLELWLGEAKLYEDAVLAIREAASEIRDHTQAGFMRSECLLIANKLDPNWPLEVRLRDLIDRNTSLDKIFSSCCIPVLICYNSRTIAEHGKVDGSFSAALEEELRQLHSRFVGLDLPPITIHLILLPMGDKGTFVDDMHRRLKACQSVMN
jgi:hypothetical protein